MPTFSITPLIRILIKSHHHPYLRIAKGPLYFNVLPFSPIIIIIIIIISMKIQLHTSNIIISFMTYLHYIYGAGIGEEESDMFFARARSLPACLPPPPR